MTTRPAVFSDCEAIARIYNEVRSQESGVRMASRCSRLLSPDFCLLSSVSRLLPQRTSRL